MPFCVAGPVDKRPRASYLPGMASPQLYEGRHRLTDNWALQLPAPMAMRIEEESLVFWLAPRRFSMWLTVAQGTPGAKGRIALDELKAATPGAAYDASEDRAGDLLLYSYRLDDGAYGAKLPALYACAIAPHGEHVLLSAYFDHLELLETGLAAWRSLEWHAS